MVALIDARILQSGPIQYISLLATWGLTYRPKLRSVTEISLSDFCTFQKLSRFIVQNNFSRLQHVSAIGDTERHARILLN